MDVPQKEIIRSKRRSLSMHVTNDAKLIVKAPLFLPIDKIEAFIEKHAEWIQTQMNRVSKRPETLSFDPDSGSIPFLGSKYAIQLGNYTTISIKKDVIEFPQVLAFRQKKEIEQWYIKQARTIITKQVDYYAQQMGVTYTGLTFSDTRSQWGSCTHDNRLQFCWRLIMAPLLVINYVVVHELTHITEKNHSSYFWSRVRRFCPSYRQSREWLKDHGDTLS
jgi:predicted metal-dependent hydrolase